MPMDQTMLHDHLIICIVTRAVLIALEKFGFDLSIS